MRLSGEVCSDPEVRIFLVMSQKLDSSEPNSYNMLLGFVPFRTCVIFARDTRI